ncbi:MAG: alpha/beta hydrolase [Candidatus Aminicenantales bacterium]
MSFFIVFLLMGCTKKETQTANEVSQQEECSGIVSVEGAELHYIIEGNGIPWLGLGHSESQRRILSPQLRNYFRFVFVDLRHDARSSSSLEIAKITLDTYLDDVDKVRSTLGLDKVAVFGHSHHAFIAMEYARKYPANTSHLIITGCKPRGAWGEGDEFWETDASDERKMVFNENWKNIPRDRRNQMSPKERQVTTYVTMTPKLLFDPRGDLSSIVNAFDNDRAVFLHYQTSVLKDYDIMEGPAISTPVFLALGRYDYISPYLLWDDRKDVLLNLSYNLFEKSGHFPMVEEQELFDRKLIEWIKSH